jgi:hypothetical protein
MNYSLFLITGFSQMLNGGENIRASGAVNFGSSMTAMMVIGVLEVVVSSLAPAPAQAACGRGAWRA